MILSCFCINLESDQLRRNHCASEYARAGLGYTMIAATDGRGKEITIPSAKDPSEQDRWDEVHRGASPALPLIRGASLRSSI